MTVTINIYTAFSKGVKPDILTFKKTKEFYSQQEINDYVNKIINQLMEIYEDNEIPFSAIIKIEEWKVERN